MINHYVLYDSFYDFFSILKMGLIFHLVHFINYIIYTSCRYKSATTPTNTNIG